MKKTLTSLLILTFTISFGQVKINYCNSCDKFDNDKLDFYKTVSKIHTKKYKGSPVFQNLSDLEKKELLEESSTLIYNEFGKIKDYESSEWLSGFETRKKSAQFTYDENGKIISSLIQNGPSKYKETFEYDETIRQITQHIYKYNGIEIDRIIKFVLNDMDLIINRKEFFGNGSLYKEDKFKFDSKGNEIFSDYYGVKTTSTYKYDKNGNILSESSLNNYKKGSKRKFKYNSNGNVIEKNHYKLNDNLISKISFKYENGVLIKQTEHQYSNGKVYSTQVDTYVYDEKDNWTTKLTERNDILVSVIERTIEYK